MISVTHFFPLPVGRQQQKTTVMNVAVWADLSQTCGQQEFSRPTLLLWLVCSEWSWKNVKRHRVDRVSPEGRTWRGGKTRQRVGGLHWPIRDQRKPQGETGAGSIVRLGLSFSIFCFSRFFKAQGGQRPISPPVQGGREPKTWGEPDSSWKNQQYSGTGGFSSQ